MSQSTYPGWYQPVPTRLPPRDPPPGWQMAPAEAGQHRRIRFELLAMLVLAALPSFIIGLEGIDDPQSISTDLTALEVLYLVASATGPALMAIHLLWRDKRLGIAGFGRRSAGFIAGYGLLGLVCVYLALFTAAILASNLYVAFGGDFEDLGGDSADIEFTAVSLVVAYVISLTAGVTEEIVFRAYAITRLEELGWKRAAVIVPGVVFTVLHLYQGLFGTLLIGAVTVAFTWLYRWKRSIWPVIVAHALFDGVQLTIAAVAA
jgi:membrane protease YdiL (CAAX protease family)